MTETRSGNFISNVSNRTLYDVCLSIKRHGHVKNKVIKSNIECNFPSTKNVSKNDVFQASVTCMRLLPVLLETASFKEFEEKVGKINIANFDVDSKMKSDKACEVASDVLLDLLNSNHGNN